MRTDGVFKTKLVRIKNWPANKPLSLIPFGDIHHDSPSFCKDKWAEFLAYAKSKAKQNNVLFLGMGDYFDGFSTSERAIVYDGRLHESSLKRQEKEQVGRIARLAKDLEFMRGKLIGLLGGNHYSCFSNGDTSDTRLAEQLGTSYLGACCAIRLTISRTDQKSGRAVDIFAHHGKGGGTTAGGKMNSVEKLSSVCDADIYLMGDNHARGCMPMGDRLFIDTDHRFPDAITIRSKTRWIGRTGSFLRAYVEGESNYVVDAAMQPANLGWIEFLITLKRQRINYVESCEISIGAKQ